MFNIRAFDVERAFVPVIRDFSYVDAQIFFSGCIAIHSDTVCAGTTLEYFLLTVDSWINLMSKISSASTFFHI